jgi:hypothetical protein
MRLLQRLALSLIALLFGADASAENDGSVVALTLTQGDYGGGRIYLPVRLGNVMGTMRLDTGASTTRITLAPWNKDLPSLGQSASTGAAGETVRCEDIEVKNVELKAVRGNNVGRAKYLATRCAASDGDDLLGLDFFKNARFSLDFARSEMVFFPPSHVLAHAKPFRRLGPDARLVGIPLRLGKAGVVGLFDTGAELSAVDRQFVETHKKLFTLVTKKAKAGAASGKEFAPRIYKLKELDLGEGLVLRDLFVLSYDFGALRDVLGPQAPIVLGYNVLSRLYWELDFAAPGAPGWSARARDGAGAM